MAREDLKVGQHISALRMANKAIVLTGTLSQINDDGKTVEMTLDGDSSTHIETVHVDDVTVLGEEKPAEPPKSLTTVNGVAI